MTDLIIVYSAAGACILLGFLVHHMVGIRQLIERTRVEEREDLQKLHKLMEEVRGQRVPRGGDDLSHLDAEVARRLGTTTMCISCSVGSAKPPSQYCDACREMMPKLKPKDPPTRTVGSAGGPTTPTGVRA